jgi:hypothetical protein
LNKWEVPMIIAPSSTEAAIAELHEFGLGFPGASIRSPWPGHRDLAVKDKTFAFLSTEGEIFRISCKLPISAEGALLLPFVKPTGYGLGKSGWVTAELGAGEPIPLDLFKSWVEESYRDRAPKKFLAQLPAR